MTALRSLLSLLVPARGHRACAEAESRLCGLLTSERDARRGDRDAILDGLVVWLEQRAQSFDEDARHLRAKAHSATLPTAVAAALREAITDLGRSE